MVNTVNSSNSPIERVSDVKHVTEYRMANGLKVVLAENHIAPVITLLVLYKVGSRNEGVGYTGATHFLEHMLFKGTKKHNIEKGNGIDNLLTQIGAYWNATTWFDRTSYFEVVPSEFLELCIKLESDRMRNLLLRQSDRDSEMSVVRNELERGENYPEEALEKELYAIAFREHPYHHPTIGWRSDVEGVPLDRLKRFYDTFYWPNNATVILLGDFEKEAALSLLDKHFGKLGSSPEPIPQVYTVEPPQEGERRFEICRAGDLPRVWMGFHVPEAAHEDDYALAAMRHILGSTYERSSRLYRALIDTGLAADAFSRHDELRDPGLFIVGASLNPGSTLKQVEDAILAELDRFASEPVSQEELSRAKSANLKGTILAMADPSSLAFLLGEAESKADWQWLMNYDDEFEKVTADDIMSVASRYFRKNNRTVGYFKPLQQLLHEVRHPGSESNEIDEIEEFEEGGEFSGNGDHSVADMVAGLEDPVVSEADFPDTSKAVSKDELVTLLADAPKTVRVRFSKTTGGGATFAERVRKEVLPNGMTVLLMSNPGTQSVGLALNIKAGRYFTRDLPGSQAELVGDLLCRGSSRYSKMDLAEALEGMGIPSGLEFSVDNYRMGLATHVVSDDFNLYLDLLNDVLRNPLLAADELEKIKIEWTSKLIESANNTRTVAWNGLKRALYPDDHPFAEKPFTEQLEELQAIAREDLLGVHRRLLSPRSTILSIVGDIDLDMAFNEIAARFGDWQGEDTGEILIPTMPLPERRRYLEINIPDKSSVDIIMSHPTTLRRSNKDFYAARIANAAIGQDTITSRLGNVVRDRAGLTYGIYSVFSDSAFGGAPWSVVLTVNPSNIEKALRLVDEVLDQFMQRGITREELQRETGRAVGSFKVGLSSSIGIARVLAELEFIGLGVKELDVVSKRYLSVTKNDADAAMRKYFHPNNFTSVVAGTLR
ncbi:MAG: insulinase family protein [Cyanobacteria bacterium HKST-UBA02]|nr:insulinase family protein [Cyanobacteria bacterium HKST-UBA02]